MSIVVAVRDRDQVVMAADTLTSFGDSEIIPQANSQSRKIMRLGDSILGATGWGVYDDILHDYLFDRESPDLSTPQLIFSFFLEFWKALHDGYPFVNDQAGGKDTPFGDLDTTFLIANESGIFKVSSDLGVSTFAQYYAIGSGAEYALGAIHALLDTDARPATIARAAVQAACAYDVHCGGEVDVLRVE